MTSESGGDFGPAGVPERPQPEQATDQRQARESSDRLDVQAGHGTSDYFNTGRQSYATGQVDLPRSQWEQLWTSLSGQERYLAQHDESATLKIMTTASRLGSDADNKRLTDERAAAAEKYLRENYHIKSHVELDSRGEQDADPKGPIDNPRDRAVVITVTTGEPRAAKDEVTDASPKDSAKSLLDRIVPEQPAQDNSREFLKGLWDNKSIPKIVDSPAEALKFSAKLVIKTVESLGAAHENGNFSRNFLPAFHAEFDKLAHHPSRYTAPRPEIGAKSENQVVEGRIAAEMGRLLARRVWDEKASDQKQALQELYRDEANWNKLHRELDHQLRERLGKPFGAIKW